MSELISLKKKRKATKRAPYNKPDELDIKIKQLEFEHYCRKLVSNGDGVWEATPITDAKLRELMRNTVRDYWMSHPVKLAFLESRRLPDHRDDTRSRFVFKCDMCGELQPQSKVDVDHIHGVASADVKDFEGYARSVLEVSFDDLQILGNKDGCGCHEVKTYAESQGISLEGARAIKPVIKWENSVKGHKAWCVERGAKPKDVSNKELRRVWMLKYIEEGNSI